MIHFGHHRAFLSAIALSLFTCQPRSSSGSRRRNLHVTGLKDVLSGKSTQETPPSIHSYATVGAGSRLPSAIPGAGQHSLAFFFRYKRVLSGRLPSLSMQATAASQSQSRYTETYEVSAHASFSTVAISANRFRSNKRIHSHK